jgi:stage II sporulation protein M
MKHLRLLWAVNKTYVYAAGLLLIAGVLIGYVQADLVDAFAKKMLSQIEEIVDKIKNRGGGVSVTFWAIFLNNLFSAVSMMLMGLIVAVVPIFGLLSNGVLLGYLMQKMAAAGMNPFLLVLVGIMPHGIFELPAVVFAAALGIRYGTLMIRSVGAIWLVERRTALQQDWISSVKQFPLALAVIVFLLVVAAFVESAITPEIIKGIIGTQFQSLDL